MEESCNIYVHFMRKKLYVQTTRTNYTVTIRDTEFTEFYGLVEYDRTNESYEFTNLRIEFTDEYDRTHRMKRKLFIFNLLMQQS